MTRVSLKTKVVWFDSVGFAVRKDNFWYFIYDLMMIKTSDWLNPINSEEFLIFSLRDHVYRSLIFLFKSTSWFSVNKIIIIFVHRLKLINDEKYYYKIKVYDQFMRLFVYTWVIWFLLHFFTWTNDRQIDPTEIDSISLMNQFDVNQSIQ